VIVGAVALALLLTAVAWWLRQVYVAPEPTGAEAHGALVG